MSTLEVEATISNILELKDATAYGVEIPNTEGRAGMVTILVQVRNEARAQRVSNESGLLDSADESTLLF